MGTWDYDSPSGVYRNHALSNDIRIEATRDLEFARWLSPEPNFGKGRGETINLTRIRQMAAGLPVAESENLPSLQPNISTTSVTVAEWGAKIELSSKEDLLTYFDVNSRYRRLLRDNFMATVDRAAAVAMKSTPVKYICSGAQTGTWDTDGTPSTSATFNLSCGHVTEIRDYMKETLNVPTMRNGRYVGILSTKAARGIKSDATYKDWLASTRPDIMQDGALVDVDGVALYECNFTEQAPGGATRCALDNTIGTGGVCGEAVFFGDDCAFLAEVLSPEIRAGTPMDLGRKLEVGWYGILQFGLVWELAATTRIVHVSSS